MRVKCLAQEHITVVLARAHQLTMDNFDDVTQYQQFFAFFILHTTIYDVEFSKSAKSIANSWKQGSTCPPAIHFFVKIDKFGTPSHAFATDSRENLQVIY